ncbi:MAG TPA: DUF4105 domain-containing protein [Gammaproteobacteria bacterium]|nr:DUF4105 domain-containing protein [Gammaproteobacteria bacterium]
MNHMQLPLFRTLGLPVAPGLLFFCFYLAWLPTAWATDIPSLSSNAALLDKTVEQLRDPPGHYLTELLRQAEQERLWEKPVWQRLMHYKPTLLGGTESQVDGNDFFLSARGKHDARAELRATLAGFFTQLEVPPNGLSPQCRFPARYFWLNTQLHFDPKRLPVQDCPKFDFFMDGVRPHGITVVFPAEHPDSPSSMFGHTLLRLDRADQTSATRMLDYTVNFAAEAGDSSGVGYAINGLTGTFEGRFRVIPYYMKLREYAQMENRDIWEYRLKLSPEQTRFITMHTWEMVPTYYDYYFFTENCAYHLLSLIEPALPERTLTDSFGSWVLPVDILRVLRRNDLVADVRYYPSRYRIIQARREHLDEKSEALALDVFNQGLENNNDRLQQLDAERQADILDLAYEYRRYAGIAGNNVLNPALSDDERALLLARSRLGIVRGAPQVATPHTSPDKGHLATRLGLGFGANDSGDFLQLDWRAVYHDWLDPLAGHSSSYALAFGSLAARYYSDAEQRKLRLRRLHVVRIDNMEPWDAFFRRVSWRVVTGIEGLTQNDDRQGFILRGGPGISIGTNDKHLLGYGLLEAELGAATAYADNARLAAGPAIGLMASPGQHWRLRLTASYLADARDRQQDSARLEAGLSWGGQARPSLRLSGGRYRLLDGWYNEAQLSLKIYF